MPLIGLLGKRNDVNDYALLWAADHQPSLIIDCANIANPHKLTPYIPPENLSQVYMVIAESIYRYRDSLKKIEQLTQEHSIKNIIITTPDKLFDYQDKKENKAIHDHAWQLMHQLSKQYNVCIATPNKKYHHTKARIYCTTLREVSKDGAHSCKPTDRYGYAA